MPLACDCVGCRCYPVAVEAFPPIASVVPEPTEPTTATNTRVGVSVVLVVRVGWLCRLHRAPTAPVPLLPFVSVARFVCLTLRLLSVSVVTVKRVGPGVRVGRVLKTVGIRRVVQVIRAALPGNVDVDFREVPGEGWRSPVSPDALGTIGL